MIRRIPRSPPRQRPPLPILPIAPTNLAAAAISSTQVALNWHDASLDETSFIIERSPNGTTGWTQVGTTAANATTFTDATATASTQFFYRVHSANGQRWRLCRFQRCQLPTTPAASTTLPSPWTDADIGTVGTVGSGSFNNNVYTVNGAGADIWNADRRF